MIREPPPRNTIIGIEAKERADRIINANVPLAELFLKVRDRNSVIVKGPRFLFNGAAHVRTGAQQRADHDFGQRKIGNRRPELKLATNTIVLFIWLDNAYEFG